jgi:hypothetical protein
MEFIMKILKLILLLITFTAQAGLPPLPSQAGQAGKFLKTDGAKTLWDTASGSGSPTVVTPPGTALINLNWSLLISGNGFFNKSLGANTTIAFNSAVAGQFINIKIVNTASYTVTWPVAVKWPGGIVPILTPNKSDLYSFFYDGTDYFGSYIQNY